jgi:hypothetical protein
VQGEALGLSRCGTVIETMNLPLLLAGTYFAVNFAIMIRLVREEAAGRTPAPSTILTARLLRYGPPLAGFFYLVTIAGDWPFVLFVAGFFVGGFWLLDGLLHEASWPQRRKR